MLTDKFFSDFLPHLLGSGRLESFIHLGNYLQPKVSNKLRAPLLYNMAVAYEQYCGDGENARKYYISTKNELANFINSPAYLRELESEAIRRDEDIRREVNSSRPTMISLRQEGIRKLSRTLEASICENMLYFSLNHDEYLAFSKRLGELDPDNVSARAHSKLVREVLDIGGTWKDVLISHAATLVSFNSPEMNPGFYGKAAAVHRLLLLNRHELRLDSEDTRRIAGLFASCMGYCFSSAREQMTNTYGDWNPDEIRPMAKRCVQLVDETVGQGAKSGILGQTREMILSSWVKSSEGKPLRPIRDAYFLELKRITPSIIFLVILLGIIIYTVLSKS